MQSFEPPLSLYVKQAIGATHAVNFDLSNACAGMLTGVFVLADLVSRGEIGCGMVVSGEYISHLSWNSARQIRSLFSKQLASLTLGDAGAAVIVERAPGGSGIDVIGFTTLAEHSRLCLAFPSTVGPGAQMYTKSRTLQKVAIDDMAPLVAEAIGATQAVNFDLSNACAGMLTGVFILQSLISRGEISRGMVVSGEYISHLSWNAARQIRSLYSKQLASLTLGDAGAAVMVERAPQGTGLDVIGFTTLAEHSRLCLAFPSSVGPGAQMYTKSRTLHKVAIEDMVPLVAEAITEAGIDVTDIDYMIPHQTSARAIHAGTKEFVRRFGAKPKHVVVNLEEYGNTSSTTLFVALHKYLEEQRIRKGDRVMLFALASGIEIGVAIFTIDNLVDGYGHVH